MQCEVAIVGGGLAGLHAARRLHAAGVDVRVFEARSRPGGRIHSVDATGGASVDGFDLGPSWFWPRKQPGVAALVAELGLPTFAQNDRGDVVFERMSREEPHRLPVPEREPQSLRIAGGTSSLVRALAADLPDGAVLLGARVQDMRLADRGVELLLVRDGGVRETVTAGQVILAVPPRVAEAGIGFTPPLPPETAGRWRGTPTWMAPHAKFFALYDEPFWRDAGFSGTAQSMVGPMMEMHDATTASGGAALFGFLGMGPDQRAAAGEARIAQACIAQFARIFGEKALSPRATLYKDWADDPLTTTADDRFASGHAPPPDAPWVQGLWSGWLSLAGSETSAVEPGYLAGAVEAGTRATAEVSGRLAAVSASGNDARPNALAATGN